MEASIEMTKISPDKDLKSSIAMTLTLVSFSMLFAAMLLGYVVIRFNNPIWPPMGMSRVDLFLPTLSTAIIALSSVFYVLFERASFKEGPGKSLYLYLTLLAGFGFMGIQLRFWDVLKLEGFYTSDGVFPSLIYGMTWTHAGHIVLALALLIWLAFKNGRMESAETNLLWIKNTGKFWHFLGVVWLVLYLSIFVF